MKFQHKGLFFLGSITLVAVLFGGFCLLRPQEKPVIVRIGYLNITASLPLFIAEAKGFFEEEGIQYESFPLSTSNQLVDGIAAGNLDLFPESSAVPILALEAQLPGRLKIFSTSLITKEAPFDSILVKDNSSIVNLSKLAGKKIAVFPGSTATALLKQFLADQNVDVSGITFVPVPPQNQLTALLQGAVDALHAYEPTTAIALSKGGVRKLLGSVYAEMLEPNPQGVAAISVEFARQHPQTAEKAIRAIEKAMRFMKSNDTEARQILAQRLKLDTSVAQSTVFLYMAPRSDMAPAILQQYADMLARLGEIKGTVNANTIIYSK